LVAIRFMAPGELIGAGRSGEVYAWGTCKVLKVFRDERDREHVEREFHNTRAVRQAGIPAPEAFEIIRHGDKLGIVYERAAGAQLERYLVENPWAVEEMARKFAALHLDVHRRSIPELPWQVSRYLLKIRESRALPFALQRRAMLALCALPLDSVVCHGDFTPPNVIVAGNGEAMVIDWPNVTSGNPIACVAETALNLVRLRENCPRNFMEGAIRFRSAYLAECERLRPSFAGDFAQWEPVVAAAMLNGVTYEPERERLQAIAISGLS